VNERPDAVGNSQNRLLWDGHIGMLERTHPQALGTNRLRNWGGSAKFAERLGFGGTSLSETYFLLALQYGSLPAVAEWPAKCTLRNAF
jgi:hypothetical protein